MTANWWTLVPIRGIAGGKSRLAPVLDANERAALNRWLLVHTLEAIERWRGDLTRCLVVSPCDEALKLAHEAGAVALREAGGGLNAALEFAAGRALAQGAGKLLVVACDLPDLNADALAALAELAEGTQRAAIAPDRARTGTNALALDANATGVFRFGADSCQQHLAALGRGGVQCAPCERAELAFDLDTPVDHAEWAARRDARIRRGVMRSGHKQFAEAGK